MEDLMFLLVFSPVELLESNGMVGNFKFCNPTAVSFCLFQSCYVVECFFWGLRFAFCVFAAFWIVRCWFRVLPMNSCIVLVLGMLRPSRIGVIQQASTGFQQHEPWLFRVV